MILSKHPRNATNTWLPGGKGKSGVVSLRKETRIPRRREPVEGGAQHGICENGRLPWRGQTQHTCGHASPTPEHLPLLKCHRGLPGGPFHHTKDFHGQASRTTLCVS